MKYLKGHLHQESWSERESFAHTIPVGTEFDSGLTLCFWDAIDAQPCFAVSDNSKHLENLTISTKDSQEISINNVTDITAQIEEISKTRNIEEIIKKTNGFIAL